MVVASTRKYCQITETVPMTSRTRVDLNVHISEKEDAKAFGARWDRDNQTWYAPPGTALEGLKRWLPRELREELEGGKSAETDPEKGVSLSELLARVRGA